MKHCFYLHGACILLVECEKRNDSFQITISVPVKLDEDSLEILCSGRVVGESLSGEMASELTLKGQEEPAMERAWRRARQAEGTEVLKLELQVRWEVLSAQGSPPPFTASSHRAHSSSSSLSFFYIHSPLATSMIPALNAPSPSYIIPLSP